MNEIINVLMAILIASITAGVITSIKSILQYSKIISNEDLLDQAIQIVQNTVDEVNQTYVEELKNKNQFDSSAQKEALQIAINKSATMMSSKVKDYILSNYDDLTKWIITQVESYIWNNKNVSEDKSQVPIKLNG